MNKKQDLLAMTIDELELIMDTIGEKTYRAKQLFSWLHKGVLSFDQMTNIPKSTREKLSRNFYITHLKELKQLNSRDGLTTKYLYLLPDDNIIECVVMEYSYGTTLCLSTQVGCKMGCSFCASTKAGLIRDLTAGEMLAQVLYVNKALLEKEKKAIRGLVLMGSGEPLDNYNNTLKFLQLVHDPQGLNIGYRNITLSTCGLVPDIRALAEEGLSINLAVSLHAPNDSIRGKIMRVGRAYRIKDIIDACSFYFKKTGRRITFEYAMINKINDKLDQAKELANLLKGFPCHVNIIPLNQVKESELKRSNNESVQAFIKILEEKGVQVTRRREMGADVDGACGQLRSTFIAEKQK